VGETNAEGCVSKSKFKFDYSTLMYLFTHSQKTARKELLETQAQLHELQDRKHAAEQKDLEDAHAKQLADVQSLLDRAREGQRNEETKLRQTWKLRDQILWERIEAGIKVEEERLARRLEEERRGREEEERKRKEEELKKKLAEEKRLQEEAAKKEAEEEKKRLEEEMERNQKEAQEKRKKQQEEMKHQAAEEVELRTVMSFNPADDDWRVARENLQVKHDISDIIHYLTLT
jgi:nucleoporin GLE1